MDINSDSDDDWSDNQVKQVEPDDRPPFMTGANTTAVRPRTQNSRTQTHTSRRHRRFKGHHVDEDGEPSHPQAEHLIIFGYSSRIFRDDETAASIEEGAFLLPWHGETENPIMLDRYDVRNLLDDRRLFQKMKGKPAASASPSTDAEIEEEKVLDEERYRDLDSEEEMLNGMSEDERENYLEEKRKRRQMEKDGKLYGYQYEQQKPEPIDSTETQKPPAFKLKYPAPQGVATPDTERLANIIEKTAQFINNSSNPQMEILIQGKQANNPDFAFLNRDDPLYAYYLHVRLLLRTGLGAYGDESGSE
ncbi:hypothetical protein HK102_004920, partial [Quaeritorhiza haematococci]